MENGSQTKRKTTPPEMKSPRRKISDAASLPQPINETLSLEHFEQCLSTTTSPNSSPERDESNLFVKWLAERKNRSLNKHNALKDARYNYYQQQQQYVCQKTLS